MPRSASAKAPSSASQPSSSAEAPEPRAAAGSARKTGRGKKPALALAASALESDASSADADVAPLANVAPLVDVAPLADVAPLTAHEPTADVPPAHVEAPPSESEAPLPVAARQDEPITPSPVNYDDEGLLEVTLDEDIYRFDAGKQGTAVCLSRRTVGVWSWDFLGELRWDGKDLRSRTLDRKLLAQLAQHLKQASADSSY